MDKRIFPLVPALLLSLVLGHSSSAADIGDLIKLTCPTGAATDHPCRAVYYLGIDGKRHSFPNADVYFSWYDDFSPVQTVDGSTLASWPLGRNVTYRPGSRLVKLLSVPTVYAVDLHGTLRAIPSETAAAALAGPDWSKAVSDIPDVFFLDYQIGEATDSGTAFSSAPALAATPDINADLGARHERKTVTVGGRDLDVRVITLDRSRFRMKTVTLAQGDCLDGCAAAPLADYATANHAAAAIHGSYFCPPDYADCVGQEYSFRWPAFDSTNGVAVNESELKYHEGPLVAQTADGALHLWRDARIFTSFAAVSAAAGSPVTAALANYPTLLVGGVRVVDSEPRLDEGQRTVRGSRGGIGWNAEDFFLVVVASATVPDLADVMAALGATDAMNLDGGGSSALLFGGEYKSGPGRLLPNAIVFSPKP